MMTDDPLEQLKALRAKASAPAASADPLEQLKALRQPAPQQGHDYHAEFQSGALQKRMAGANARDMASAHEEDAAQPGMLEQKATNALSVAQGIPGMEALEAGAGALGSQVTSHPMGYRASLNTLRGNTDQIDPRTRTVQRALGSTALIPFLPGGAVASGAIIGGADQALDADPDVGLGERAARTVGGAGVGALVGKLGETAITGARGLLSSSSASALLTKQMARAASAKQLYGAAMQEGQGKLGTAAVRRFLGEPDIAEIVSELQQTRPFQGVQAETPEMLDAVYKTLSDRSATIKKGLESISPTRPNIGRFRGADVKAAQSDLLDAASGGGSLPGPMPSYRTAVNDFAERSADMNALQRGQDAMRAATSKKLTTGKNLLRTSPEAFGAWAQDASTPENTAASEGVLGAVKEALKRAPLTTGRRAIAHAPSLLRATNDPTQALLDLFAKGALTFGNQSTLR